MTIKEYVEKEKIDWFAIATYDGLDDFCVFWDDYVLRLPEIFENLEIVRISKFAEWVGKDYPLLIV